MPAAAAPALLEALDGYGIGVAAFEDEPDRRSSPWTMEILHQGEPDRAELRRTLEQLTRRFDLPPAGLEVTPVPADDWLARVREQVPPQRIGRFWIHGSEVTAEPPSGAVPLCFDAGLAFGSGEHATTRGCLLALDALARRRRFSRVLDLGCGSGILGVAAATCWPARVLAVDNDPTAVEVAAANARLNRVGATFRALLSDGLDNPLVRTSGPYDLILANILARPLIALAPGLARALAPRGHVVLSGLLVEQVRPVAAAYRARGLTVARLIAEGPWATLQLGRPLRA